MSQLHRPSLGMRISYHWSNSSRSCYVSQDMVTRHIEVEETNGTDEDGECELPQMSLMKRSHLCIGLTVDHIATFKSVITAESTGRYAEPLILSIMTPNIRSQYICSPRGNSQPQDRHGKRFPSRQHRQDFETSQTPSSSTRQEHRQYITSRLALSRSSKSPPCSPYLQPPQRPNL